MNYVLKYNNDINATVDYLPKHIKNNHSFHNHSTIELDSYNSALKDKLLECKSRIDEGHSEYWDIAKKTINEYENILLYLKFKNSFRKTPISRAYFKLHEIMTDYSYEFSYIFEKMSKSAHLAEGPGGFIESFVDFSSKYNIQNVNKYTITLKTTNNSSMQIPLLKFSKKYIENYNIKINYGMDGTGDIFKLHNINYFVNFVQPHTCDFITADGGFDFSENFNTQEEKFNQMLVSEVLLILNLQKNKGCSIIKLFDFFNTETQIVIYILSLVYNKVYVTKPLSSRPANSEKYLVCCDFVQNNYTQNLQDLLQEFVKNFSLYEKIKTPLLQNIEAQFKKSHLSNIITEFNDHYTKRQVEYIRKTLKELSFINDNIKTTKDKNSYIKNKLQKSMVHCEKWCNSYNPI